MTMNKNSMNYLDDLFYVGIKSFNYKWVWKRDTIWDKRNKTIYYEREVIYDNKNLKFSFIENLDNNKNPYKLTMYRPSIYNDEKQYFIIGIQDIYKSIVGKLLEYEIYLIENELIFIEDSLQKYENNISKMTILSLYLPVDIVLKIF